jgi:hypothetical protein
LPQPQPQVISALRKPVKSHSIFWSDYSDHTEAEEMPMRTGLYLVLLATVACSGVTPSLDVANRSDSSDTDDAIDSSRVETIVFPDLRLEEIGMNPDATAETDSMADAFEQTCEPGEGCFLDECEENSECQSSWCVEHLGEAVCTQTCQEECPTGWKCKQVGGTDPDVVFICVSDYANLCKPCADNDDCGSTGGASDVCVDYGIEGDFCGGQCSADEDCPWGFSCLQTQTVDGLETSQCVNDAGVCPCTDKSVSLALWTTCENSNKWGTCEGKRVCTEDGLTSCDVAIPDMESCNGIDDDCDGEIDEPDLLEGEYVSLCDDDNLCTDDACKGSDGCENLPLNSGECLDGDPCTVADHCVTGICVGDQVECDDENPCTDNICTETGGCEYPAAPGQCDDGNPCTVGDLCQDGLCQGTSVPCDCQADADCTDLEDQNQCNGSLICDTLVLPYKCNVDPATIITCPEPDGIHAFCLQAKCAPDSGLCSFIPDHEALLCDNGNACTVTDKCSAGVCDSGIEVQCNDGNPCTDDTCNPDTGCVFENNELTCNDGDVCTTADLCLDGQCTGGPVLMCDDSNACNGLESCDSAIGCVPGVALVCDDGNPCNGLEICDPTEGCVGGPALECDDGNLCTDDICNPVTGCVYSSNTASCEDGNACTEGDHCVEGACVFGTAMVCEDANICTDDECDPAIGCVFTLNDVVCDDQDICSLGDHCHLGDCIGSNSLPCDDGNICTDDSCNMQVGCQFQPNNLACDDGNACTKQDTCSAGWCAAQGVTICDDANSCTDDTCHVVDGCQFVNNLASCSDNSLCTTDDMCAGGSCLPGPALVCDDGNACTDDSCEADTGCVYVDRVGPCSDKNACTDVDECVEGTCVPGQVIECDDSNICTDEYCDTKMGCVVSNNSVNCDNENVCTTSDTCADGKCASGPALDCDDLNECTEDDCSQDSGCTYQPVVNDTPCTQVADGTCQEGVCASSSLNYATGNEAYWTERLHGFRTVTIGGGEVQYTYNPELKQYRNADTVLLPTTSAGVNGQTISATDFYGFQGGSPSDSAFQWDGDSAIAQPNPFDIPKMFVSPMLMSDMSYCAMIQAGATGCGGVIIDGPDNTLAYPDHSPKSGTYNIEAGSDLINAGNLKGTGNQFVSQQQLDATPHQSYCVATYGKGWRLATDVEMGHTTDEMNQVAQIGYRGTSSYRIRTSTSWPGLTDQRWCPYSDTGNWQQCNVGASGSRRVRCVFPGGE